MIKIKVCGVTNIENAAQVATSGADLLGLNFWRHSKRCVDRMRARSIAIGARRANPEIKVVGVFVNQSAKEIEAAIAAATLDYVQLHGDESAVFAKRFGDKGIKALPIENEMDVVRMDDFECVHMLVDSASPQRGGSGEAANWELAAKAAAKHGRVFLAGGLTPENVGEAIARVRPYGVDVASGVESSPGIKDVALVTQFVEAVRTAS